MPIHTARFVVEATKAFPKDGIMIRDGGATVIFQWTYSQCKPHDVIWNQNFGHIGTGLPYATGAMLADAAATKSRPGMLLTSDSSFLFHIGELETAVALQAAARLRRRRRLPVGPGGGRLQAHLRPGHEPRPGTHWGKIVRFDKIAEGFGCHGEYVDEGGGHRARDQARLCQRQADRDSRADRPEGQSRKKMPNYDEFRTWYAEGTQ